MAKLRGGLIPDAVAEITLHMLKYTGQTADIATWIHNSDRPGYIFYEFKYPEKSVVPDLVFQFTDPDTAFEFKMRWV